MIALKKKGKDIHSFLPYFIQLYVRLSAGRRSGLPNVSWQINEKIIKDIISFLPNINVVLNVS